MNQPTRMSWCLKGAFVAMGLAWATAVHASGVSLTFTNSPAGTTVSNGAVTAVSVLAIPSGAAVISNVTLSFQVTAPLTTNLWNTTPMATTGVANTYQATIPRVPAGTVSFFVTCVYNDSGVVTTNTATNSFTVGSVLDPTRNQGFEGTFTGNSGPQYNYSTPAGWTGTQVYVQGSGAMGGQWTTSAHVAWLISGGTAFIMSPLLTGGVGTVYCQLGMNQNNASGTFLVQASTNSGSTWQTIWSNTITVTSYLVPSNLSLSVGITNPTFIRFSRLDNLGNYMVLDNINISYPPASLTLAVPTPAMSPLTPQSLQPVTLYCNTQDGNTNEPTINRQLNLVYNAYTNGVFSGWLTQMMVAVTGSTTQYQTTVALNSGTNAYYFTCNYDGYYYTNMDKSGTAYYPAGAPAITNLYVIGSAPNTMQQLTPASLYFGNVVTNQAATNLLWIGNIGNADLHVTNIVCTTAGFFISSNALTIAMNTSQSVAVVFAPTAKGFVSGTVSVLSDMSSGTTNIMFSGTGMDPEQVPTPVVSGPAAGMVGVYQNFTAASSATDNWGYAVQYQFSFGSSTTAFSTAASASNIWNTAGIYNVAVQAASATNIGIVSLWSAPVSITITNTRIIGLNSNSLAFGSVATNANLSLSMTVTNSGNGPLTVSSLVVTNALGATIPNYTISPTNFVLAPGASTNVTVTFAPSAVISYNGQLEVHSDAMAGTGSIPMTGQGYPVEMVSTPYLIAPTTGMVTQAQTIIATNGVDNYTNAIQYQIDWGDNSTNTGVPQVSGSALMAAHIWTNAGTYNLKTRAWSSTSVTSFWSSVSSLVITNTRILSLGVSVLNFGSVVTNTTSNLVLAVANSGNGPLTVTSITNATSFYGVSASSFVLQAGFATNLTISFHPLAVTPYVDTLTILSDATTLPNGGNTVTLTGTGLVTEAVSQPKLTPVAISNTVNQSITFTASATDNWGTAVQYLFNWGDGTVSNWTSSASLTHAWSTAGVYTVTAQAQSLANPTVTSTVSAASSVTITNNTAINVTLATSTFGPVSTGTSSNLPLTVSNIGNGPLTVTGVTFAPAAAFTASPQTFTLAVGGSTNVVITFAPVAVTNYASTVTVLVAGPFGGSNTATVTGSGVAAEIISAPQIAVAPSTAGTTGDVLTVTNTVPAASLDSWGLSDLSFHYDTGDGQTSGWTTVIATNHVWTNAGVYTVRAQATNFTRNVGSPWSSTSLVVRIYPAPLITFAAATNGVPMPVTISVTNSASSVTLYYLAPGSTATTNVSLALATNSSGFWTNSLPPLNAGFLNYYVVYTPAGTTVRYPAQGNLTLALTNYLGGARQQFFAGTWSTDGAPLYDYWNSDGWTGTEMFVAAKGFFNTNFYNSMAMILQDVPGAFIMTPDLRAGIGTIYFQAGPTANGISSSFNVQISTNAGLSWWTQQSYTVSQYNNIITTTLPVNLRQSARIRFVRTTSTGTTNSQYNIAFANILISPPSTDVTLSEYLYNPGYPNAKDPTRVRCIVSDVDAANEPSVNRRVTLYYQAPGTFGGVTNSIVMSPVTIPGAVSGSSNSVCYEGVVPVYPAGGVSYYFRCDFDGYFYSNSLYSAASENQSPEYLGSVETNSLPASYRTFKIGNFRSDQSGLSIQTDNPLVTGSEPTMTLVGDYTWQALILMKKTGGAITNLLWTFGGYNYYATNASGYSTQLQTWGDTNQDNFHPPLGGTAQLGVTNLIGAQLSYDGFLVIRLDTHSGAFLAKRAVYQDFNTWTASPIYFDASAGLYATLTFTNDFSGWNANAYSSKSIPTETFTNEPSGVLFGTGGAPHVTAAQWAVDQGQIIYDRGYLPPYAASTTPQKALYLNNSLSAPGQIWTTANALPSVGGVHSLSICSRLSVSDPAPRPTLCTAAGVWTTPYHVIVTNRVQSMSPGTNASMSLILNYKYDYTDMGSFYELRLCEVTDALGTLHNDKELQLQFFRWANGVPTLKYAATGLDQKVLTNATPFTWDVSWSNMGSKVVLSGTIALSGTTLFTIDTNNYSDASAPLASGGIVGFLCADAVPEIQSVVVYPYGSATQFYPVGTTAIQGADWFKGVTRPTGTSTWWQVDATSGYLVRPVTPATLTVYQAPLAGGGANGPDFTQRAPVATISVTSLGYVTNTVSFNQWNTVYVDVTYSGGDLPVVVDNVSIDPWRGITEAASWDPTWFAIAQTGGAYYYNWTTKNQQYLWSRTQLGWAILEGWVGVTTNTGGTVSMAAILDRTRANPSLDQEILSPDLTNGIGFIGFDATVLQGTSVYRVERTVPGDLTSWVALQTFTNSAGDATTHAVVTVATNFNAVERLRIIQVASDSSSNAVLAIGNLIARDSPPEDQTSWKAYNALIVSAVNNNTTTNRAFAPSPDQTCYLNNSQTSNVFSGTILSADNPYVQTPTVDTGIGEIDFWCRAWDANPAVVTIAVAPDATSSNWVVLTNFTVMATNYQYMSITAFDTVDKVMRIYSQTNGSGRLCLDNVLMTEPIRAGYSIMSVSLLPGQPLFTDTVAVQAQIGNFLMNPTGIRVFLSYHVGTDTWGYARWRGMALTTQPDTCTTFELQAQTDGKTFVAPNGVSIPRYPIDTVVQYITWGTYDGITSQPIFQGTNVFTNPSWYYPIDLNVQYAAAVPTPYYFVYSCPVGSVWFNEFNYVANEDYDLYNEYVEITGPTGVNVSNWRMDVIDPQAGTEALYNSLTMPSPTVFQEGGSLPDQLIDGWSFLVWGDDTSWMSPNFNFLYALSETGTNMMPSSGGLRLVRSNGAYEQRLSYGNDVGAQATLEALGYLSTGSGKDTVFNSRPAPLELEGTGSSYTNFGWREPSGNQYSPGSMNTDQHLIAQALPVTTYTIFSTIGSNGQQAGPDGTLLSSPLATITIAEGDSTSIVYTASQWYRISTCATNGVTATDALGATQYVWTVFNASQNYSNTVNFTRPNWAVTQYVLTPGGTATPMSAMVANGDSTQLVYTALQWYQINGLASNGVAIAAATNRTTYTQSLFQVQANVSNAVSYLRPTWTITQVVGLNGSASPAGTIAVLNGAGTSIVYSAADWFRINTLTTNGQSVASALGRKTNTLSFVQVTGSISNVVGFDYATPAALSFPTNVPTSWVSSFGHSETTPFDNDGLGLAKEYLLNTDPYTSNTVAFGFTSTAITNGNAYVTVRLLVDNAPHRTVNGQLKLYGGNGLTTNTWSYIQGTAVNGTNAFDVTGQHLYILSTTNGTQGFTHAVIE